MSDTWEHLAQPYENGRDALCTADDKAYGGDDEYDACHVAQRKDFTEDGDAENDGGNGLQGTEDGCRGRPDALGWRQWCKGAIRRWVAVRGQT